MQIDSNLVNGGALWHWTWNGKQFLSNVNGLRGTFSFFFLNNFSDIVSENGDDCYNHAPIVSEFNFDNTQSTMSVPLGHPFNDGIGNPCIHPVVWKDVLIGKRITLNYLGMGPVAKYKTLLWLPNPLPVSDLYQPVTSLDAQFNRFWTYDAETADLEEVQITDGCENGQGFFPNYGGIIASDQSTGFAMGIYAVNASQGGSMTALAFLRHVCDDGTYSRMDVIRTQPYPAGRSSYNAYMMTGSVQQVRQYMDALFRAGVR